MHNFAGIEAVRKPPTQLVCQNGGGRKPPFHGYAVYRTARGGCKPPSHSLCRLGAYEPFGGGCVIRIAIFAVNYQNFINH